MCTKNQPAGKHTRYLLKLTGLTDGLRCKQLETWKKSEQRCHYFFTTNDQIGAERLNDQRK